MNWKVMVQMELLRVWLVLAMVICLCAPLRGFDNECECGTYCFKDEFIIDTSNTGGNCLPTGFCPDWIVWQTSYDCLWSGTVTRVCRPQIVCVTPELRTVFFECVLVEGTYVCLQYDDEFSGSQCSCWSETQACEVFGEPAPDCP